jgi:hypothetical protein
MRDRTVGVILTVVVILLLGVPGIACVCLGLTSFMFYPLLNNQAGISPVWTNTFGAFGLCAGFILLLLTILISYLLLHRKPESTAMVPATPTAPINSDEPTPPPSSDEPLPPPS